MAIEEVADYEASRDDRRYNPNQPNETDRQRNRPTGSANRERHGESDDRRYQHNHMHSVASIISVVAKT
jgi:hypothetical protein